MYDERVSIYGYFFCARAQITRVQVNGNPALADSLNKKEMNQWNKTWTLIKQQNVKIVMFKIYPKVILAIRNDLEVFQYIAKTINGR